MSEHAKILVIDDDENVCKVLAMTLEAHGYMVDTAKDGREAIEKSNANFYNLALVDIRLPDMDGTALLTAMRETTPRMVKIIVTGYPSLENAIEAVNKNADGYIVKPFKTEQLLSTIEEHLKKQRKARQYSEQKVAEYIETRAKEQETKEE
jgi:DNA-binding NtrC family response regulator